MTVATSEQIAHYETAPARVAEAIAGLSDKQFHYVANAGDWSIHEVVVHLADAEMVGSWRLRKILAEENVTLQNYDEEGWAKALAYQTQRREQALALFTLLRTSNAELLRSLQPAQWERTAIHEARGLLSVHDVFQLLDQHINDHLEQIANSKRALPATSV